MSLILNVDFIDAQRAAVRTLDDRKIRTDDEAVRYVDQVGFAPLFRLAGLNLPSLSDADAGETDGAWRWKEVLPAERRCAYGKFLRGRGFFVSWRLFPAFYTVYGRATDAAEDYADGLLGQLEWAILQAIQERGPLDSRALWAEMRGRFGGKRSSFGAALTGLQRTFRIMVSGGSLEGWSLHYWDVVERCVPPGLLTSLPGDAEAREALLMQFVANTVICTEREAAGFFRWDLTATRALVARLLGAGKLALAQAGDPPTAWLTPA
jgi:hypothetical protein